MQQYTALLLSLAVEAPAGVIAMMLLRGESTLYMRAATVAVASTLLSHPFAWYANTVWLWHLPFAERAAVIELSVVAFEAMFYIWLVPLSWKKGFMVSLIANTASFALGLLCAITS